ncbi:GntR family transcriptional regulator [Catenulispora sp. NF23]|uniref:GntR family transcriptional regulator n=1 Tax=Catenulispora pinistramenti TaxID=2705254 RepID=A0ABS5L0U6_9ACTN|nr:GntR family transcriptional regulator [Catenulispora pinistramenti]MBS2540085.1 GntR family transcriptional regulator [Catenulispora pinistramenti]MBS2551775.1 GntR family transcriptional regulator [Catenulispora pinistramenti]
MDEGRPLFQQIAEQIESSILDGTLAADTQVPSTNELAAFHRINPATAAKGVSQLVTDGILYKKRGIGMFVASDARRRVLDRRRDAFARDFVEPLLAEARRLGLSPADVQDLIEKWGAGR